MKLAKFLTTLLLFGVTYYAVHFFLNATFAGEPTALGAGKYAVLFGAPFVIGLLLWGIAFYLMKFLFSTPEEKALEEGAGVSWKVQELAGELEELRRRVSALESGPAPAPAREERTPSLFAQENAEEGSFNLPRIS